MKKPAINRFLKQTNALAVSGYTNEIDWMRSAAFDMIVMSEFAVGNFNVNGAQNKKRTARRGRRIGEETWIQDDGARGEVESKG